MMRVMKILAIVGFVAVLGGHAANAQEPAATPPPMPAAAAVAPAPSATSPTPAALKAQCMAALNADDAWTSEPRVKLEAVISKEFYDKLDEGSRKRHNEDAQLIARNKRHVVLAYAAIWLLSLSFIIGMWLRQQKLKAQLETLRRDLEAAIKS